MRRVARALGYVFTLGVVFSLAEIHGRYIGNYDFLHSDRLIWTAIYVAFLLIAYYASGLPESYPHLRTSLVVGATVVLTAALGISIAQLVWGAPVLPRFVLFWSSALLILLYSLTALFSRDLLKVDEGKDRILFVGTNDEHFELDADIHRSALRPSTLSAFVPLTEEIVSNEITDEAEKKKANLLVIDLAAQRDDEVVHAATQLHKKGTRVRTLGNFYDEWVGKVALSELERMSLMFDVSEIHSTRYARQKRLFDVVVGLLGCLITIMVAPFVLIADLIGNRGRLIYSQPRVGRDGVEFTIYKFRTMKAGPTESTTWTVNTDDRLTPIGRVMRKLHLDELPQSWNILKGDLSLVGPRPEQPQYVEELRAEIPFYDVRHLVRPGLTGWAQIHIGYGASVKEAMNKLQYDIWYLRQQRIRLDVRIVARTIREVVRMRGL